MTQQNSSAEMSAVTERMALHNHEQVVFCQDNATGLKAIVAIHNTTLGPAVGGTRMWMYASEGDALTDVLRLSRGMTYKRPCRFEHRWRKSGDYCRFKKR